MTNKESLLLFAKVLAVFVASFFAIITNVEIWNLAADHLTDGFHVVISVLNFLMEAGLITFFSLKYLFKKKATESV